MKKKVLFIEDEEDAHLLMHGLLQSAGYDPEQITACKTLGEATAVNGAELEIIITDLSLPDSDYHDTLRAVCRLFPYVPIIVLTGRDEPGLAINTIQHGGQDYLVKGDFTLPMLTKSIQYSIERKRILNDYARLFRESPVPMYIYEKDNYRIVAVNEAATHSYGYTRAEFLKKTALSIRPEEDRSAFQTRNLDVPNTYQDAGRWRHVKANGDIFYVHIYAFGSEHNGRKSVTVLAIDIDNKVRMERDLRDKVEETRSILDSITDGFYSIDRDWRLMYVNRTLERITGQSHKDLVGKNIWEVFPGKMALKFYAQFHHAMTDGVDVHFTEFVPGLDVWLSVNAYPTKSGIAVFFVDITEQTLHLQKIQQQNQQLMEIAWIQSHEVRRPVANVLGLVQLFNNADCTDPINAEIIANLKIAATQLDDVIRRIHAKAEG
jgi:PAS domain S-box-containing protein